MNVFMKRSEEWLRCTWANWNCILRVLPKSDSGARQWSVWNDLHAMGICFRFWRSTRSYVERWVEFLSQKLGRSKINFNFLHHSMTFMTLPAPISSTFLINCDPHEITQKHPPTMSLFNYIFFCSFLDCENKQKRKTRVGFTSEKQTTNASPCCMFHANLHKTDIFLIQFSGWKSRKHNSWRAVARSKQQTRKHWFGESWQNRQTADKSSSDEVQRSINNGAL